MEYYIKVLLVDDDPRYAGALQDRVYTEHKIELVHFQDWDDAKTELKEYPNKYGFIILDAYGRLREGESGDNPQHITAAIRDINRLFRNCQYYILTAYIEEVKKFVPDDEKIFRKNREETLLFSAIRDKFSSTEKMIVGQLCPKALTFVDKYFLDSQIKDFIDIYHNIDEPRTESGIVNDLQKLRVLNERNMDNLGLFYEGYESIKDYVRFIAGADSRIKLGSRTIGILKHFSNNVHEIPAGIYSNTSGIYNVASKHASHSSSGSNEELPSNYMLKSFKYGLLEAIEWVGQIIESK